MNMNYEPNWPAQYAAEFVGDNEEQLRTLLTAVDGANEAILKVYNSENAGDYVLKADGTGELTQADLASNRILMGALQELFPGVPIVSEEGEEPYNRLAIQSERFWLVDPLDGTKEFLSRSGDFTVCLALVEDNRPIFGIISAPVLGVTYYGGPGLGSFRVSKGATESIYVGEDRGIVFTSRTALEPATEVYIAEQYPDSHREPVGSQLKFPYIAEGKGDAFPRLNGRLCLWDVAAGEAILTGAGGSVMRPDGSTIDYRNESLRAGDFIARNR